MNEFLFSPTKQFVFPSGKILAGGKVYVFIKHTNTLATLYNDEGVEIANPVILDSNGRATVLADDTYEYKMDVYTPDDELLFTATGYLTDDYEKDFAVISTDGSVSITPSISGYTDVWDLSVSGKFDTSSFENFYTNTYGPTVGDIYHKINDISATVSGGKLDVTAFNLYSAGVRGDLNIITGNTASISQNTAMLDDNIIQNMNNINAVSGGLNTLYNIVIPEIRTDIIDVSSKLDTVSAKVGNKLDSTAFDDFISNSYSPNMSTIFSDIGSLKTNKFDSSAFSAFIDDSYGPNMSTIYQGLGNLSANKQDKITWEYNADGEISAADGSAFAGNGGYYSKYQPYGLNAISGNLVIEGSRYPRQTFIGVSSDNRASTAGIIPPVPEQNLTAERYLVAASGSLADVSWKEIPNFDDIQTNSGNWNSVYNTVESNSSTWNTVTNKLDTTAFSTVSGNFVTNGDISATEWNSVYETVETNSGSWTGTSVESYDLSAGDNIQINKDDVNSAIGIAVTGLNQTNWNNSYTALTSNSANWNNTRTVVYNNSANWNNTRSTVQSNSASWAQGTTYTEGDGIDITNNVISLDSPIVFSAGSGLSVTMDSNTARIDVTAQGGGGAGGMEVANLDYSTLWDEGGNEFHTITGYDGSAFGLGSFYVTNSDSILKNGGDSLIEINDIGIRLDNPDGGYSEQNSFYGGDYFHIGSYRNQSAYIEGYADGSIELFDVNHISGRLDVSSISSWNDTFSTVQTNSATWGQGGGGGSFTGVTTDATLTGNGLSTNPLGVAEVQSLTSDNSINITVTGGNVVLGVADTWFNNAVNSAVTGTQGDAEVNNEVHTNSGNWNDTYTNVSTNSAGWGGDTVALSAGEGIGIDLGVSAVTISSTYGSDISYLSATIGDVESLLAQL